MSFEGKTTENHLLQKYFVENAGSVIITPRLNSDNKIFTPEEIKAIKNLTGTIAKKVEIIKAMYLMKRGYDKDLIDIEIKDLNASSNGETGHFDVASGKIILYIDQDQNKANEELVSVVFHELRHFEQHARLCKIVGLENVLSAHDNPIQELEQELSASIKELEDDIESIGNDAEFADIKRQCQETISAQKAMLEELPSRLLNKTFWEKAIAQTKANENFSKDLTLFNWLNPESCPRLEEYDDGRTYEMAEYYTNPFEVDAYKFEIIVKKELGISFEDTEKLLEINVKLKTYLKTLYEKKLKKICSE